MTVRLALVATAFLLLAGASAAHAATPLEALEPAAPSATADCLAAAAAPPCGYIVPQISLDFPDKPPCRAKTLGGPIDLEACLALPAVGDTITQSGVMRFSWDVSQDGTYPQDPACAAPGTPCITVVFSGTATNPKWMKLSVEPAEVVLDQVAFLNPENFVVNQETQQVIFLVEVPLTVTFERTDAGTDDKSVARIERAQGAAQMFLKAKSSASGQYFKEAFGVEEFRFNACANEDPLAMAVDQCAGLVPGAGEGSEEAPALGWVLSAGALAAVAAALRRRA